GALVAHAHLALRDEGAVAHAAGEGDLRRPSRDDQQIGEAVAVEAEFGEREPAVTAGELLTVARPGAPAVDRGPADPASVVAIAKQDIEGRVAVDLANDEPVGPPLHLIEHDVGCPATVAVVEPERDRRAAG